MRITGTPLTDSVIAGPAARPSATIRSEQVVGSQIFHRRRYLKIRIDTIERATAAGTREVVGHPGGVAVLALDDEGRLLLVRQWRVPAGARSWRSRRGRSSGAAA